MNASSGTHPCGYPRADGYPPGAVTAGPQTAPSGLAALTCASGEEMS